MKPRIESEIKSRIKPKKSLIWIFESLEDDPRFVLRKLFSFDAAYLDGRLYLAAAGGKEPWNGLMVCTGREHHESIRRQFPQLASHEVLGKWLYLSQTHPDFEKIAIELAGMARKRDPRLGVEAKPRKQKSGRQQSVRNQNMGSI
jgi:hypothetical protein